MKIILASDLHMLHDTVPTSKVLGFVDDIKMHHSDADVLILAGDQFDKVVPYENKDIPLIHDKFIDLANFCKDKNISIYVLKGTPSHDGNQNIALVATMTSVYDDVTYIDKLTTLDVKGYNIAFYPDPGQITFDSVLRELSVLKDIDILVTHMAYTYNSAHKAIDEKEVVKIPKYGLISGHVHQHSIHYEDEKFICSISSYERLGHNIYDTGLVSIVLNKMIPPVLTFHINKNAFIFQTFYQDVFNPTVLDNIHLKGVTRFRLVQAVNPVELAEARLKYSHLAIRVEVVKDEPEEEQIDTTDVVALDSSNIIPLLLEHCGVDDESSKKHLKEIAEML